MITADVATVAGSGVPNPSEFSLSGTIEPTRVSPAYRFGPVAVAIAMLVLPLLYLALIAGAAAAVWWHLTSNAWLLKGTGGGFVRTLLYAAPAVAGIVVVGFMIKPILARPAKRQDPLPLLPHDEPRLFALIDQICRQVRAPIPARVQVDCQVNASASFRHGGLGALRGGLVLTIGLPLAAGLTVRQLGGVLAHEFGHFAQGGGMRLTMPVRGINGWFGRVAYERDEWDERLAEWSQTEDWRAKAVVMLAIGAVWLSRKALIGLLYVGHAVSCFMLRQMEYDADSYEVKFAGSDAFAQTMVRLRELNVATAFGYQEINRALASRILPANLPAYLVGTVHRVPRELLTEVRTVSAAATKWSDTHPADSSRIAAAESLATPGVLLGGDEPAAALFQDFVALSAAATRHYYAHDVGLPLDDLVLAGDGDVLEETSQRADRDASMEEFFGSHVSGYRPLRLSLDAGADAEPGATRLAETIARMADAQSTLADHYREYEWLENRFVNAYVAQQLMEHGFPRVKAEDFELATGTLDDARSTQAWARERQATLVPAMNVFEQTAGQRLSLGMMLAADGAAASDVPSLVAAFNALSSVMPALPDVRRLSVARAVFVQNASTSSNVQQTNARIAQFDRELAAAHGELLRTLSAAPCPRGLGRGAVSLAEYCGLQSDQSDAVAKVGACYFELLGRVVQLAITVETASTTRRVTNGGVDPIAR
jgi:Zn-dependent protease with chaperone function